MRPEDFDFPFGQVATAPLAQRDAARLMVANRGTGRIEHRGFRDIAEYLDGCEVWVNNSKTHRRGPEQQPIYAAVPGGFVPPTAGLPFTKDLLDRLHPRYLTMHISGPSEQEDILLGYSTNRGWVEPYWIPQPPTRKVTAVGTSVVKALETWARTGADAGLSNLFVQPPFEFKVVDKFLTCFYFPKQPLVAMTSAFGGIDLIREAYTQAVREKYRFSEFGDRLLVI